MRTGRRVFVIIALMVLCLSLVPRSKAATQLVAAFINVGQGDSCWLHLPSGDDILIDGGQPAAGPTVVAYLEQHGVGDIELMVATHGDADHIGGLPDVLESMPVYEAWLNSLDCTTQTCQDFYQALADYGVVTATVRMGESYNWGEVTALVLNPSEPLYVSKNENSIVLRVSYGSVDFLLTGDAETGAEGRMLASGLPVDAEVLKVSHHGSNSASSAEFLSAVAPHDAIISVGPNSYGHPRSEVLQRLTDVGARIWRTDQVGTVTVTTDGVTWSVTAENMPTLYTLYLPVVIHHWPVVPTATPTTTRIPTRTPTPTVTPSGGNDLRITHLQYSGRDEYVEITNNGPGSQDMTNWKIHSVQGDQWYTFPAGYVLAAGSWVRVHSGPDALDSPPSDLKWTGAYIWNNSGDEARLINAQGEEVDRFSY